MQVLGQDPIGGNTGILCWLVGIFISSHKEPGEPKRPRVFMLVKQHCPKQLYYFRGGGGGEAVLSNHMLFLPTAAPPLFPNKAVVEEPAGFH